MGASATLFDTLIELSGLGEDSSYTTQADGRGDILGLVDTATYTDSDSSNSATDINTLNETTATDGGTITIDGTVYSIQLVTPLSSSNPVVLQYDDGSSSVSLTGDDDASTVAFIVATPTGGGSERYFMVADEAAGDLTNVSAITTYSLNWDPSDGDVAISPDVNTEAVVCFARGTMIETDRGPRAVDQLVPGDRVITLDHGPRPILWCHAQTLTLHPDTDTDMRRPVHIRRGALGTGLPHRDLRLSPQHRVLARSKLIERMFGTSEILVPAVKLLGLPGITRDRMAAAITYVHLFLGEHEIVMTEGAPVESLLPEPGVLRSLPRAERTVLKALVGAHVLPARPVVDHGPMLDNYLRRLRKNGKPFCAAEQAKLDGRALARRVRMANSA